METLADTQMRQFKALVGYEDLPTDKDLPGWVFRIREASASVYEVIARDARGHQIAAAATEPEDAIAAAKRDARAYLNAKGGRPWER
jgi:hypothetical protein